jgi:uncharacterized membrane protein YfcA
MIEFLSFKLCLLLSAAFFAGLIDSMVGGGGLIQIPALFSSFPNTVPATLFGTNKLSSIGGTFTSAINYLRVVKLPLKAMSMAAICALFGSFLGAYVVTQVPGTFVRIALPWILSGLLIFTLLKKDMGLTHQPKLHTKSSTFALTAGVGLIGFYDGFLGPGTGSFFMFLFAHFLGFDFLHSAAATKVLNSVTNFAALALFIPTGHIDWPIALAMLVFNILGGKLGSGLALKNGSKFIRKVFIAIVVVLIIKSAVDAYF